jgi:hypothetical protein
LNFACFPSAQSSRQRMMSDRQMMSSRIGPNCGVMSRRMASQLRFWVDGFQ